MGELQRTYRGKADPRERDPEGPERAILIACRPGGDEIDEADRLAEAAELLRTAGAEVIERIVQHRPVPDRKTFLGKGRLAELVALVKDLEPDLVAAEGELSPGQQRQLEDRLNTRVVDRTAVILDIFAQHARTAEGKLQVELAQLEYYYARQEGLWQHLERLGGGVGTRGPGETQLEVDRRLIRTRMGTLRRRLRTVAQARGLRREERLAGAVPRVALAGYTNAGKSSLMNALTRADVSVNDALFETLDSTTRLLEHDGCRLLVSDTVGFIRHLPHQLVEAFSSTLEEVREAELIVHVADASEPEPRRLARAGAVAAALEEIDAGEIPRIELLNKIDLLDAEARTELEHRHPETMLVSAFDGTGLDALRDRLADVARRRMVDVRLTIPHARGDLLAAVYQDGVEVEVESTEEGARIVALLPAAAAGRLRAALRADSDASPNGAAPATG